MKNEKEETCILTFFIHAIVHLAGKVVPVSVLTTKLEFDVHLCHNYPFSLEHTSLSYQSGSLWGKQVISKIPESTIWPHFLLWSDYKIVS